MVDYIDISSSTFWPNAASSPGVVFPISSAILERIDLLFRVLLQNKGQLSIRARENEFSMLKDTETDRLEAAYRDLF